MNGLMDPSPKEVKSMELVRKMKSKFEGSKYTTNLINSKPIFNSQDAISKLDVGQLSRQANSDDPISVNAKNKSEIQSQINRVYTKLKDIENGVVLKNEEILGKIDDLKVSFQSTFLELVDRLNELHLDNKVIIQVLFDLDKNIGGTGSFQNDVGEELDGHEDYLREALNKLEVINADLDEQENRASSFSGPRDDLVYLDVEHRLLEILRNVELIKTHGNEDISKKKENTVERLDKIKRILESNLISSSV